MTLDRSRIRGEGSQFPASRLWREKSARARTGIEEAGRGIHRRDTVPRETNPLSPDEEPVGGVEQSYVISENLLNVK
jgi:hypothetical protein